YPFRFLLEATVGDFPIPVDLNDILDLRDKGRIWTFDLNPVQQKNQYKITTDEARELLRLLLRNNPIRHNHPGIPEPYAAQTRGRIEVEFASDRSGRVQYEGWLNAWFMCALARGELKDVLGE